MNNIALIMEQLNIDLYSTLECKAFNDLKNSYAYVNAPFVEQDLEKRINFKSHLKECQSILVIVIPHQLKQNNVLNNNAYVGKVSTIALKEDYHTIVNRKLDQIEQKLRDVFNGLETKKYVDTGPLIDKIIAQRARIGYIAKNNLLLSNNYGTAMTIGYLLLNKTIELKNDQVLVNQCSGCTKCIEACPTGAITEENQYDYKKCISFLTQKKGHLTYEERENIKNHLYGCDICQTVCPANHDISVAEEYLKKDEKIDLIKLIELSNKAIKKTYSDYGFTWIGSKNVKRNALINLGNYEDEKLFDQLIKFLDHPSKTVRVYTLWALYKSNPKAFKALSFNKKELTLEAKNILKFYKK